MTERPYQQFGQRVLEGVKEVTRNRAYTKLVEQFRTTHEEDINYVHYSERSTYQPRPISARTRRGTDGREYNDYRMAAGSSLWLYEQHDPKYSRGAIVRGGELTAKRTPATPTYRRNLVERGFKPVLGSSERNYVTTFAKVYEERHRKPANDITKEEAKELAVQLFDGYVQYKHVWNSYYMDPVADD